MSIHEDDQYETVGVDAAEYERYKTVRLDDETIIVYSQRDEDEWIQSSAAVDLESVA